MTTKEYQKHPEITTILTSNLSDILALSKIQYVFQKTEGNKETIWFPYFQMKYENRFLHKNEQIFAFISNVAAIDNTNFIVPIL